MSFRRSSRPHSIAAAVAAVVAALTWAAVPARCEVRRVLIDQRGLFADGHAFGAAGPYERLRGRLEYVVGPDDPALPQIVDADLAPRDDNGRIRFVGDFLLLKPVDWAGQGRVLLYDVNNRGGLVALNALHDAPWNNDPRTLADAGDGLLFERGWALLWTAWNWDVQPGDARLQIALPTFPAAGRVAAEIVSDWPAGALPLVWGHSRGYPPVAMPRSTMTVRSAQRAARVSILPESWRLGLAAGAVPYAEIDGGFQPGLIYEVVYTATSPRVVGLGLLSIRDALAFFRYAPADAVGTPNPLAPGAPTTLAFGVSQSGRVLNHMLLLGLNRDASSRPVFDGALIHVAGAGKGDFNRRFAQTTRHPSPHEDHGYAVDVPPFLASELLAEAARRGPPPKLMFSQTSTEYWTRAASLLHVSDDGARDRPLDSAARLYVLAGGQHFNVAPATRGPYRHCRNPLDHRPALRALILALADWVGRYIEPPPSAYPSLRNRTLGRWGEYRHLVPGATLPPLMPPRLTADVPAKLGDPYVTVVPLPDADGNDRGGIRLPLVAVPLGAHRGWNVKLGAVDRLDRWFGSFVPFGAAEIRRRYPDAATYRASLQAAAAALVTQRRLLARDVPAVVERAVRLYRALAVEPRAADCGWLQ